jgi:hypothetical protein
MEPIITLPGGFNATIASYMGQLFTDLSAPISLIIGVLLGLLVIEVILGIFRK